MTGQGVADLGLGGPRIVAERGGERHEDAAGAEAHHRLAFELGAMGVFLASDGAAAITGQVIYVDGGYQIMGM